MEIWVSISETFHFLKRVAMVVLSVFLCTSYVCMRVIVFSNELCKSVVKSSFIEEGGDAFVSVKTFY